MPVVDVPFPTSNAPGSAPGEGGGRLLNCYAYKEGDGIRWRAVPGLTSLVSVPAGVFRGALLVGSLLFVVIGQSVVQIGTDLSVITLAGTVLGDGPVTMEHNNDLQPDIVITSNRANYIIKAPVEGEQLAVQAYPDGNLPFSNSVAFLDGYFLFTTRDGNIFASDLNATSVQPLSVARAEARPDGLLRGVVFGQSYIAMGDNTIEFWQDVGTIPFPLQRSTVIPVGLYGPWAVAGSQDGWTEALIFVASDGSVRRLDGYTPTRISPDDLERLIDKITDPTTLVASVYSFGSNSFWSLSTPDWTWEYNITTGFWHERASLDLSRWRASMSVKAFGKWIFGDLSGADLLTIDPLGLTEAGDTLTWGMDSAPVKQFPARVQVPDVTFDFVMGQAAQGVDPTVLLSWSHNGGMTWATPIARSLGKQGIGVGPIRLHRLGLSSHHGVRIRFRISDPTYTSFAGARMTAVQRRA